MSSDPARPIPRLSLLCYSLMALPLAFAGLPLYIHAPDFYAVQGGLSLAAIGMTILLVRVFDAVQDPLIGWLSNKYAAKRPALMIGAFAAMAAGFLMLFNPPAQLTLLWFAISLLIATTAFSILTINLNALGSLWSGQRDEKTRITAWREAFGLIGLLIAAILPGLFNLHVYAVILSVLLAGAAFLLWQWNKAHHAVIARREGLYERLNLTALLAKANRGFYAVYGLSMLASSIPAVLVLFFIRDRLGLEEYTGLFLLLYFLSGALGMPLWQALARRVGKERAWLFSMFVAVAAFVWAYFLGTGALAPYALVCVFSGLALGAELALPPALLSEMIDRQGAQDQTAFYFAAMAFLAKAALAAGSGLAFLILGFSSFVPASANAAAALQALGFTYAVLPCLLKLAAAAGLYCIIQSLRRGDHHAHSVHHIPSGGHNGT